MSAHHRTKLGHPEKLHLLYESAGYLTIMGLVIGVNWFILNQLRTLSELGTELVSYYYPTVETGKHLLTSLLVQLKSDKQYLVLRDTSLLMEFLQEAGQFKKTLLSLIDQDPSEEGQTLLQQIHDSHDQFQTLFLSEGVERANRYTQTLAQYESKRDALVDDMTQAIRSYIALHEQQIIAVLSESHERAKQAENITRQLMVSGVVFGMGLAGIATFSILRPLRRVQRQIRQIGQGEFRASIQGEVPPRAARVSQHRQLDGQATARTRSNESGIPGQYFTRTSHPAHLNPRGPAITPGSDSRSCDSGTAPDA